MSPTVINNLMSHFKTPAKKAERNPLATYAEAIMQIETAVAELDQAHATLKDIGCHQYPGLIRQRSITQVRLDADAVLDAMRALDCDTCGRPVRAHKPGECEEWS
jgi:hypothetical protein